MTILNLKPIYNKLKHLKSQEARNALQAYLRYAEHAKGQYGNDTQFWPEEAVNQLHELEAKTSNQASTAERYEKARRTGGVCLADF